MIGVIVKVKAVRFLVASVGMNLAVGSALGALAMPSIKKWYSKLKKPEWTPPNAVFGPVWSVLYTTLGVASWIVFKQGGWSAQKRPLTIYAVQLALNFAWQPTFFNARRLDYALVDVSALLVMTAATAQAFCKVNKTAGMMIAPSVLWVAYAAALNARLLQLNPKAHEIALDGDDEEELKQAVQDFAGGTPRTVDQTAANAHNVANKAGGEAQQALEDVGKALSV